MKTLSRRQLLGRLPAWCALAALAGDTLGCSVKMTSAAAAPPTVGPATPTPVPAPPSPTAEPTVRSATPTAPRAASSSAPLPTAAPAAPTPTSVPRQPNVLLITIDTLRSDRLGAYGFANAHTPTLDRLAAEGVRFDRAICQLPQTNASHAALLTGLYPSTSGVKVHMVDKLRPGTQTLASAFERAGYQTAGIYSWVSLDPQFCGLDQGFQTYQGYVLNRSMLFSDPRLEGLLAIYRQVKANVPVVRTVDVVSGGSESVEKTLDGRADVTTAAVLDWLNRRQTDHRSAPFFLWVHYFDPHYPYSPPPDYDHIFGLKYQGKIDGSIDTVEALSHGDLTLNAADLARLEELYQGEIAFADSQLGKLLDDLRGRGLEDDTIIAVTGDHGESFGEHGDWVHGLKVYETEIHVPLFLRYPRKVAPRQKIAEPVQLIDVMPTLLDLAGVRAPKPVQGVSFAPLVGHASTSTAADRIAFTELADESFVSLVTKDWKIIRNDANGELQLYHVSQDEAEKSNLAADQPQLARELNARLGEMMKVSGVSK